jgi:PAS domain S-box-containing protein
MTGLIPPFVTSLIVTFGLSPISWTTFSFLLTAIMIGWGLTRFSLFELLPIANRTVIEHMPDGMIVLDHNERIISVNPAALWLTGTNRNALLGQPAAVLAPLGFDADLLRQEKVELKVTVDNRVVYLEIHGSPLTSQSDARSGRVLVLRDITERKRAEGLLKQALAHEQEVNAIKSRFVSVVSHEFRTPLAVIGTTTYLLRVHMRKMTPDTVMSKLEVIEAQVETINDLFEDVLTLSRMQTDRVQFDPVRADIVAVAHDLIAELFPIEAERVIWQTPPAAVQMALDKQLLRLILSNLVSNAFKYSQPEQYIYLNVEVNGDAVFLRVRDEGIGVPEEDRLHLFEPFFRAGNVGSIQGSGLGLSIVKEATELHGGTIALVSDVGLGSEFLLSLPLKPVARPAAFPTGEAEVSGQTPVSARR